MARRSSRSSSESDFLTFIRFASIIVLTTFQRDFTVPVVYGFTNSGLPQAILELLLMYTSNRTYKYKLTLRGHLGIIASLAVRCEVMLLQICVG